MPFTKPHLLQVEIDDRTDQELDELAKADERTRSSLVRVLIHKEHSRQFGEKQPNQQPVPTWAD